VWLFPPRTREVQLDEKWSYVARKPKTCDPFDPADDHHGDGWDHVALDPEHRLVRAVVPGARSLECAWELLAEVRKRTGPEPPRLLTSDEYAVSATVILAVVGVPHAETARGPGRPSIVPERRLPDELTSATVHKERAHDRVVAIERRLLAGTESGLRAARDASTVSVTIKTSFVERQHGTDRGHNARKARQTYRFSKDWRVHEARTYSTLYSDNFCWVVRTRRQREERGFWQQRTPAMAAGLTDHVWSLREWVRFPAVQVA